MSALEQKARDVSRPFLESIGVALARRRISADGVTLAGLLLTIAVAVLAGLGLFRWAGLLYIPAAICDALDGTVARVSGRTSRFGAFLDSTIDRIEEALVFLGVAVYYARVGGPVEIPLLLLVTFSSLMVSYTRARAEGLGLECKVGFMTRPPRVVVMIVGLILDQMLIALVLLAVTTLFTTFQRVYHVWRLIGGGREGQEPPPPSPPGDATPTRAGTDINETT
jgi:CDP-diacylglycerol---glycerol-3-phosphate 3-phosphatidyltransferase